MPLRADYHDNGRADNDYNDYRCSHYYDHAGWADNDYRCSHYYVDVDVDVNEHNLRLPGRVR